MIDNPRCTCFKVNHHSQPANSEPKWHVKVNDHRQPANSEQIRTNQDHSEQTRTNQDHSEQPPQATSKFRTSQDHSEQIRTIPLPQSIGKFRTNQDHSPATQTIPDRSGTGNPPHPSQTKTSGYGTPKTTGFLFSLNQNIRIRHIQDIGIQHTHHVIQVRVQTFDRQTM